MTRLSQQVKMTMVALASMSCAVNGLDYDASNFATEVVEYVPGTGVVVDSLSGDLFDDPWNTVLGRPTVDTTGDGWVISPFEPVPLVPVYPASRHDDANAIYEITSIGEGGHLIVKFDHPVEDDPRNPHGIDFIIFGNAWQQTGSGMWNNRDPEAMTVTSTSTITEPSAVYVSETGPPDAYDWHLFPVTQADTFLPTLGRVYDPENADTSLGSWNLWWAEPTCPAWPMDPTLGPADFVGMTVGEYAAEYGYRAGGTGFDLAEVGLSTITYVMIVNPAGSGVSPEIDALANVNPDLIPPDLDDDGDVDADDFDQFDSCSTGPGIRAITEGCERADQDNDDDVDQSDFGLFQRCYSGQDVPADPACRLRRS